MGAALLEEATDVARRRQGGETVYEPRQRPHGAVVQRQRFQSGRTQRQRHSRAAQAEHRHDRRGPESSLSGAAAADLPRREIHARRALRAALRRRRHDQRGVEQDRGQRSPDRDGRGEERREAAAR